jgi:phosphohistidine phosphatase
MRLYLLRHAEAEPHCADDFSRRLTDKGSGQSRRVGEFLKEHDVRPGLILSSPVLRAKETASIVVEVLGVEPPTEVPWLACGMNPERGISELSGYAKLDSLMIVGHEPDFSSLIAAFLDLTRSPSVQVGKASLTCINLPRIQPGSGILQFLLPVKFL